MSEIVLGHQQIVWSQEKDLLSEARVSAEKETDILTWRACDHSES